MVGEDRGGEFMAMPVNLEEIRVGDVHSNIRWLGEMGGGWRFMAMSGSLEVMEVGGS